MPRLYQLAWSQNLALLVRLLGPVFASCAGTHGYALSFRRFRLGTFCLFGFSLAKCRVDYCSAKSLQ